MVLSTDNHDRDKAGLTYVYPVFSRRAGGLSIGINLNINNACNWRCIYCQVPDLTRGRAPWIDLDKLEHELRYFLSYVIDGDFYEREQFPKDARLIKDISISGNGEPTMAREFEQVIDLITLVVNEYRLSNSVKCVLITNGSRVNQEQVIQGLKKMVGINGQVWFKIDSATPAGMAKINQIHSTATAVLKRLKTVANLCPTWIQTCFFSYHKKPPSAAESKAYIDLLKMALRDGIPIKGVFLYGVERPSRQTEAAFIGKLDSTWFKYLAAQIKALHLEVIITP